MVKICDFGLARDIYKDPDYVRKGSVRAGPLPPVQEWGGVLTNSHVEGLRACRAQVSPTPGVGAWEQDPRSMEDSVMTGVWPTLWFISWTLIPMPALWGLYVKRWPLHGVHPGDAPARCRAVTKKSVGAKCSVCLRVILRGSQAALE